MTHKMIVGSRGENRGGSEGTSSRALGNVSRETPASTFTPPSGASAASVVDDLAAGARQRSAAGDLYAFGWVLRRLSAIGLAALDTVSASDADGDVRDAVKPFLDALRWEGVKLTHGKPETD